MILVLAPDLADRAHQRILHSLLTLTRQPTRTVTTWEDTAPGDIVVSVGKAALDLWHQWGLIQVGSQSGQIFTHDGRTVMVLEHPGTMMQLGWVGNDAKRRAKGAMSRLAAVVAYGVEDVDRMVVCGGCQRTRVKGGGGRHRVATHWPEELDGAGLCDEHWRKRGSIKSKWRKARVDKSTREAQVPGQREMFAGDGTRVVVRK